MPKSLALGNNNTLIALDQFGQLYDFYYPYIGLENHTNAHLVHKIGVWTSDKGFSWLDDGSWNISIDYVKDSMVGMVQAENYNLGVKIDFRDTIYNEQDIFCRDIEVYNLNKSKREIRVFFNQQFEIYSSFKGDTAIYDHEKKVIIHYKGRRYFLINAKSECDNCEEYFDDYSIGLLGIEGKEGTYKDAEDGLLTKNNIEHGSVDSVIGLNLKFNEDSNMIKIYYWMVAGRNLEEVNKLNDIVKTRGVKDIQKSTLGYWKAWVQKEDFDFAGLDIKYTDLFKKSLFIIDSHCDSNGAIIASGDSDLLKHGRGTYSYVWPRDGALIVDAMNQAGYHNVTKNFLEFCSEVITGEGYMLHKYRSDKSLGSSWHPWIRDGKSELPIQEDETALVVWVLWRYYESTKDLEFIEKIYNSLVKQAAEFMIKYIDESTNLPKPTYDLWEEKFGVSTFTAATVYAGLRAAENFARLLGKTESAEEYSSVAKGMKRAIIKYLWDPEIECFVKMINFTSKHSENYKLQDTQEELENFQQDSLGQNQISSDREIIYDKTIDSSSVYALFNFEILDFNDPKLEKSIKAIEENLICKTEIGGVCRYQDDYYFRVSYDTPGNPWIITSLWLARYYLYTAKTLKDLEKVYFWLDWVVARSQKSGVLPEQLNPYTGEQLSATPLIWSHAEYVKTILDLSKKIKQLQKDLK